MSITNDAQAFIGSITTLGSAVQAFKDNPTDVNAQQGLQNAIVGFQSAIGTLSIDSGLGGVLLSAVAP